MFTQKPYFYNKKQPQVEVLCKKKLFLEISQIHRETAVPVSFFCEFL